MTLDGSGGRSGPRSAGRSLRILHILGDRRLPRQPDRDGVSGIVRAVLEIARGQVALGHQVTVATVTSRAWTGSWKGVRLLALRALPERMIRASRLPAGFRVHLPYVLHTHLHRYQILQSHSHNYLRFLRAALRLVHVHGDPLFTGSDERDPSMKPVDFAVLAAYSDAQIAVSRFVASQLQQGLGRPDTIHVVHNGVDLQHFDPRRRAARAAELRRSWHAAPEDVIFLFAGALVPEKGVLHLADAFSRLAARFPGVRLAVAGNRKLWGEGIDDEDPHRHYELRVRQLLEAATERGQVQWLGLVGGEDIPDVYQACDVVVVPSTVKEGLGLVALEGLASARPVIASAAGGLSELVDEGCGILVAPGDTDDLHRAMLALLRDPALRLRLGERARTHAERFSWHATALALERLYHDLDEDGLDAPQPTAPLPSR